MGEKAPIRSETSQKTLLRQPIIDHDACGTIGMAPSGRSAPPEEKYADGISPPLSMSTVTGLKADRLHADDDANPAFID